jgi:serine phosphatase RsbU (regulator of sigma subunit)
VESTVTLDRGATILFYTDGLVERRGENLDTGLARLRDTLASLADRPLESLCDELLDRMSAETEDDDVALIAVRLHRQDLPRPAEAGPEKLPSSVAPST